MKNFSWSVRPVINLIEGALCAPTKNLKSWFLPESWHSEDQIKFEGTEGVVPFTPEELAARGSERGRAFFEDSCTRLLAKADSALENFVLSSWQACRAKVAAERQAQLARSRAAKKEAERLEKLARAAARAVKKEAAAARSARIDAARKNLKSAINNLMALKQSAWTAAVSRLGGRIGSRMLKFTQVAAASVKKLNTAAAKALEHIRQCMLELEFALVAA
jgi:hypothetical protein